MDYSKLNAIGEYVVVRVVNQTEEIYLAIKDFQQGEVLSVGEEVKELRIGKLIVFQNGLKLSPEIMVVHKDSILGFSERIEEESSNLENEAV